jgi:HEAT repeat protein
MARFERLVSNKMSQNLDRQEAIEELSKMADGRAVAVLLKRFNWSMDPSITDQEEKEAAASGIAAAGVEALDPIRAYAKKAESLHWPIKILRQIVPEEEIVDELLALLDQFDTEYLRNPSPKVQLIETLEAYPGEDVRIAVEPFLGDTSEPVRFAAVTTLFAVNDSQSTPALVAALEEEESLRIKNRIAQGIAERSWEVPEELREACVGALPENYRMDGAKVASS